MIIPAAHLLDTNVISEMMRPNPDRRVAEFLDVVAREGIALSAISVWEIFNGIGRLPEGKRRNDLAFRFRSLLEDVFDGMVFDWSIEDGEACAKVMEAKRRRGESLDLHIPDAMIAATAYRHGLTLITRNEKDFRNIGIEVINPWTVTPVIHQRVPPESEGTAGRVRAQRVSDHLGKSTQSSAD